MGHRRSPDRLAAERDWRHFVQRNAGVIATTGLPPRATAGVADWDDFLMQGYVAGDPGGFDINHLSPRQYAALVELAANYFSAGYEFYVPTALRDEDQSALRARFGGR